MKDNVAFEGWARAQGIRTVRVPFTPPLDWREPDNSQPLGPMWTYDDKFTNMLCAAWHAGQAALDPQPPADAGRGET